MEVEPVPNLRMLLAAILFEADNYELTFGELCKNLCLRATGEASKFYSMQDVYSTIFSDEGKLFLTIFDTEIMPSKSSSFSVALSGELDALLDIYASLMKTIFYYPTSGDMQMLQYLEKVLQIIVNKLFAEPKQMQINHFNLPNLVIRNTEFMLIPVGPAPFGYETDPGYWTCCYEKVKPIPHQHQKVSSETS